LANGVATGFVHFADIAGYFRIAVVDVRYDVIISVIPARAFGDASRARNLMKV
jgi:hypothetical protein